MAEMGDYSTMLRSATQGRGYYEMSFARYEEVPTMFAQKIIESSKIDAE